MPIELKTIDDCKDEVAKEHGYGDWADLFRVILLKGSLISHYENEAIKAFAFHLLDYAAQEAKTKALDGLPYSDIIVVDTDSITNIKNKIK